MPMLEVLRSCVNTWECDRMGHLNVRHYFGRANEGLSTLLLELGLPPAQLRTRGLVARARDQHARFLRELRPGSLYTLHAGVVVSAPSALTTYQELRDVEGQVCASVLTELGLIDLASGSASVLPDALLTAAGAYTCAVPGHGAARGIDRARASQHPTRAHAIERGMVGAYLGPVTAEDCDHSAHMKESAFMARISDGIGHFFNALQGGPRPRGIGGAALEYRYVFHTWPRLADIIEVRTGLKAVGNKTLHMIHYVFDRQTDACVAAAEAVAVWFDLDARKAVPIPDETRTLLSARILPGLAL